MRKCIICNGDVKIIKTDLIHKFECEKCGEYNIANELLILDHRFNVDELNFISTFGNAIAVGTKDDFETKVISISSIAEYNTNKEFREKVDIIANKKTSFTEVEKNILIRILENTNVNFLIGAGGSFKHTQDKIPLPLMSHLLEALKKNNEINKCLQKIKTNAAANAQYQIIDEVYKTYVLEESSKNIEEFLSHLQGLGELPLRDEVRSLIKELIDLTLKSIKDRIITSDLTTVLHDYERFYNMIKQVSQNKSIDHKRVNIFTTNYDMLNEAALENQGLFYYSGFHGVYKRKFNLAYYNYSYSDDMNLNRKNYVEKVDNVNLYKLHGSLSWSIIDKELVEVDYKTNDNPVIVYPSITKFNSTNLIVYYSSLMREFSNNLLKQKSSLFVLGSSFSDEHINTIIETALNIDDFTLIVFAYSEADKLNVVKRFGNRSNIIIHQGSHCTLNGITKIYESEVTM